MRRLRAVTGTIAGLALAVAGLVPAATTAAAAGQTIAGVVTLPGGPEEAALDALAVMYAPEGTQSYRTVDVTTTGAFSIGGLAPGKYHVCAYTTSYFNAAGDLAKPYNVLNACFDTADYFGTRGVLDVTGGDLTGLTLALPWGRTVSGTVALGDGADPEWLRGVEVSAWLSVTGGFIGNTAMVDPDTGRYTVAGLYPRVYPVDVAGTWYTDPATGAQVTPELTTVTREGVDVTAGNATGVDATLAVSPVTDEFTVRPKPELTGSPVVGGTLTATTTAWTPAATSFTYRWYRNGSQIPGATSKTYTVQAADVDTGIHVTVKGLAQGIASADVHSTFVTIRDTFTTVGAPSVTGGRTVGSTLTCATGTWAPTPSVIGVEWRRGERPVGYGPTYTVQAADAGQQLRCHVFASRTDRPQVTAASAPVTVLRTFTTAGTVAVAGSPQLGGTLTASVSGTTPVASDVRYRWLRDGTAIPGAVSSSYVVTREDSLATLRAQAVVSRSGFADATASAQVQIPGFFDATPAPVVNGAVRRGSTLTATVPAWTPAATFEYQWLRDGAAIAGASAATYTLTASDEGATVSVRVVGSRASFVARSATSAGVDVPRSFGRAPSPTITGSTATGGTLTVSTGDWEPAPDSFAYQWLRDGAAVPGANRASYAVAESDGGRAISVRVTAVRDGYVTVVRESARVVVPLRTFTTAPQPTIVGTPRAGQRLTAKRGTWAAAPTTVTYRWFRNGKVITGATSSTYLLTTADQGRKISVAVTASRAGYRSTVRHSAKTTVLREFTAAPKPTISGTARVGGTLVVKRGAWTPAPTAYAYQWFRDGKAITGATTQRYVVRTADRGHKLTVTVTATRSGFLALTRRSAVVVPR